MASAAAEKAGPDFATADSRRIGAATLRAPVRWLARFGPAFPGPLGVDAKRTNTNEQGRPLPYFAGIAKLGVTWISEPWDVRSKPIKKKETVGFNYYARAAAIVCHGPACCFTTKDTKDTKDSENHAFDAAFEEFDVEID